MQLQLHHEELTSIQRPTVLAKIVTLKRGRTHMRLCQAPHSDHRTGCGAKERNRQGKTWMASLSFLFFLSFSVCACLLPGACDFCHNNHGSGSGVIRETIQLCQTVLPAMLCYAMLCYAMRSIARSAEYGVHSH